MNALREEKARLLDSHDTLASFRNQFLIPEHAGKPVVYFTGNSLGLQPRGAREALMQELDDWAKLGVEGHFEAKNPWFSYHEPFSELLAPLVGAQPNEVVAMGTLTNNLHLLMVSFYRPTPTRYKIICEHKAFPSDGYAFDSQARFHGFDPRKAVVEITPRDGEETLRTEDILAVIEREGSETAVVLLSGVNYYTGQVFDMQAIAQKAHEVGAMVGFDLAHTIGNIPMQLHDWKVDFATWCSYKYLNSGPGSVSGIYVHQSHLNDPHIPRFEGWWGHRASDRFLMARDFKPFQSAEAWQLSNAPVFSMAAHRVSLQLFNEAGMHNLRQKALALWQFTYDALLELNQELGKQVITVITPTQPEAHGCQLSLCIDGPAKQIFEGLGKQGIVADWREPNVIRIAPVPLYNTFLDCATFVNRLHTLIQHV